METISVVIKNICLLYNEEHTRIDVKITLDKTIRGYALNGNTYEETDVNKISIPRANFTAQVCNIDDSIDQMRACREHPFDQQFLALIFRGATLDIVREKKTPEDVILDNDGKPVVDEQTGEEKHYKRDCYVTNIVGLHPNEYAAKRIADALSNINLFA